MKDRQNIVRISILVLLVMTVSSCSKLFIDNRGKEEVEWVYTYRECICGGNENYFVETNYPQENFRNVHSVKLIFSSGFETDKVFHMYINEELFAIQRFQNSRSDYNYYPGVPEPTDVVIYTQNPLDPEASLVFSVWSDSGDSRSGLYFSTDFPFKQNYESPNDTIVINFFRKVE
jgi:hypothetical protein